LLVGSVVCVYHKNGEA